MPRIGRCRRCFFAHSECARLDGVPYATKSYGLFKAFALKSSTFYQPSKRPI